MDKTNVMRILDYENIKYVPHFYDSNETDGESVARLVGIDPNRVYKTLVTISNSKHNYVFCIPVNKTLDLKKAAKAACEKKIEMLAMKDLLPLTGYVHGGCSPIGMKKQFKTFIYEDAMLYDSICVYGGKKGTQIELASDDLIKLIDANYADIC